jgi:sialidase-1
MKVILLWIIASLLSAASFQVIQKDDTVIKVDLWTQADTSYTNFRIPALIVTKENTLLAFAEGREAGDTGDIDILVKRSKDNGKTWSKEIVVWDDGGNTCGNPTPVIDRETGRIILLMTWNLGTDHESKIIRKTSEQSRLPYMTFSDDDGVTWSKPKALGSQGRKEDWGWYATGPGIGIQMKSPKFKNRIVIPCNHSYTEPSVTKRDGFGYGAHVLISDDGGENWRLSRSITPEVNESQIIEFENGVLQMNMRSYNGTSQRAVAYSSDGGDTWSEVSFAEELIEPVCQASILSYGRYDDGELFLFSNPASTNGRKHMTIKTSNDQAKSWKNEKLIYYGPSAYSCLTKLPNGRIGLFFEAGISAPYERMVFVSFEPHMLFTGGALLKDLDQE